MKICASIEPNMKIDVSRLKSKRGEVENECLSFFSMLRYKEIPTHEEDVDPWINGLCNGDKDVIYPILYWCFSNHEKLKKRAYLARFLTPIHLPLEITMSVEGQKVMTVSEHFQMLQCEFKEVHKHLEALRKKEGDDKLKDTVRDLQEEKCQLLDKLNELKDQRNDNHSSFDTFLDLTSALRKEQDKMMCLQERIVDKKRALSLGEARLKQLQRRQKTLRSITNNIGGASIDTAMSELEEELAEMTMEVKSDLISERNRLKKKIEDLTKEKLEPLCTKDELEEIQLKCNMAEEEYKVKKEELRKEQSKSSHNKVAIFKQHAAVAASKLKAKELELGIKIKQLKTLEKSIEVLETQVRKDDTVEEGGGKQHEIILPDGHVLENKEQADDFSEGFKQKMKHYDMVKKELSEMQYESLILQRSEDLIQKRHTNFEEFLKKREENAGIEGYHNIHAKLRDTEENRASIDNEKGETLQQITDTVKEITKTLNDSKEELQPLIKELKATRAKCQALQQLHSNKKGRYDRLSSKLSSERYHLENECNVLQKEWLAEERNYHHFWNANEIAKANFEKAGMEKNWRKGGTDKMLPEFSCLHELYENKFLQQENMAKQLRNEQKSLRENRDENLKQRQMFLDLDVLMEFKMKFASNAKAHNLSNDETSIDDDPLLIGDVPQVLLLPQN